MHREPRTRPKLRKRICPDCKAAIPERQLRIQYAPFIGEHIECPRCWVGSKVAAWKHES